MTVELPLSGLRVAVTRARTQAPDLVRRLSDLGALAVEAPLIEIADPADNGAALGAALSKIAEFDWLVLTSANAVERCWQRFGANTKLGSTRVAAIGPRTAEALAARGVVVDLVPKTYVAESLSEVFPASPDDGSGSVLLACAKDAREVLANGLSAKGWRVVVVEAYRTLRPVLDEDILQSVAGCDVVTFASSSAVTGYLELAGRGRVPPVVACIGPITARSAAEAGLTVQIVAREHTAAGLVDALVEWQANRAGADERQ